MSQPSGITEFLTELNESDSASALRFAYNQKSPLIFKIDSVATPLKATIDSFLDKRAFLSSEIKIHKIEPDKEVSIKFNVGTEVYFIKTFIKSHLARYYFDMNSKVIQLKRRREPRYIIPKKWAQSSGIVIGANRPEPIKCNVIDISLSGIRFEVLQQHPEYKRDDIIKINFQIYKRAEVSTLAIVRFVLVRPNASSILGLEFAEISNVQKERVSHIIQDINLFNSLGN
ncbi:MAG: PilZ domain-containing protein [Pseudobdellovibrio sp.]